MLPIIKPLTAPLRGFFTPSASAEMPGIPMRYHFRFFRDEMWWKYCDYHTQHDKSTSIPVSRLAGVKHRSAVETQAHASYEKLTDKFKTIALYTKIQTWIAKNELDLLSEVKNSTPPESEAKGTVRALYLNPYVTKNARPAIVMLDKSKKGFRPVPEDTDRIYGHEFGHHMDMLMGFASRSQEFRAAYKQDLAELLLNVNSAPAFIRPAMAEAIYLKMGYFLPAIPVVTGEEKIPIGVHESADQARSEAFADLFMLALYKEQNVRNPLESALPNCTQVMQEIMEKLDQTMDYIPGLDAKVLQPSAPAANT